MRYLLIAAFLLFGCVTVHAENSDSVTVLESSPANWDNDLGSFGDKLRDKTSGHSHTVIDNDTTYEPEYEVGPGLDLVVFEADANRTGAKKAIPDSVEIQTKWDFANDNGSTYVVAKYNIWDLVTKKEK